MTTPSLRDAQVAKLIAENERLRGAIQEAYTSISIGYTDQCGEYQDDLACEIANKLYAALAEEQGE